MATNNVELIVFSIGSLNLALPIKSVYKVSNYTPIYGSGVGVVGVTRVDGQEVTVIDLYRRFFKANPGEYTTGGYLVQVLNAAGELYGIPVVETPVLMEVSLSLIRVLPQSYRYSDTLDLASHVAVIPQNTASLTIFLLDVDQLLPVLSQGKSEPKTILMR
ncbi:MAG: chemotaxis protein CheW [Coleofasciculaceae cyanobacterium]